MAQATKSALLVLLLAVLAPAVPAGRNPPGSGASETDQAAAEGATVGTVLTRLAHSLDPDLPGTIPPGEALTLLRGRGLALEGEMDLKAPLTAIRAARLFAAAGLTVNSDSEDPEAPLPAAFVAPLVEILHLALAGDSQP